MTENLLTQKQVSEFVAQRMAVSFDQVYKRLVHHPEFPKPIQLPSISGTARKRWSAEDVNAWLSQYRVAL